MPPGRPRLEHRRGIDYIVGTEENVSVIAMVTGKSAPQPPKPASGPYGPGCIVGG